MIMAQKFSCEFNQAIMLISEEGKKLQNRKNVLHADIMACNLEYTEFKSTMFCIGFTKSIRDEEHLIDSIWAILTKDSRLEYILSQSLWHYLCYILKCEIAIRIPKELVEKLRHS
jgi:hypothetical protein